MQKFLGKARGSATLQTYLHHLKTELGRGAQEKKHLTTQM